MKKLTRLCAAIAVLVILIQTAGAVYIPDAKGYDPKVDYMAHMIKAAENGGEYAMALGRVYEVHRNNKINDMGLAYETTDFFVGRTAKEALALLREYITPKPEPEPEPKMVYAGDFYITGYDLCYSCCGKTDGITASGVYATVGRTIAASSEFAFGTRLYIEGIGERVVEDRGGAIGGGRIDVLCNNHDECYAITGWYPVYLIVE